MMLSRNKGFTLIELMIVLAMFSVLSVALAFALFA